VRKEGVLVISHGSPDSDWVALVDRTVQEAGLPEHVPVVSCFLEAVEGRLIQDGIDALEAQGVTDMLTVPLFISSGSTHIDEIEYALGVKAEAVLPTELKVFGRSARVRFGKPIDDDAEVSSILYERVRELSIDPSREVLLLIGHGSAEPGFHEKWMRCLSSLSEQVGALGGFAATDVGTMLPDTIAQRMAHWASARPEWSVIVAPLFLSEGYFTRRMIPSRLDGYTYRYHGRTLLPHPALSEWIRRQVEQLSSYPSMSSEETGDREWLNVQD
jgi:sirohydrochlorin ferrochelatase